MKRNIFVAFSVLIIILALFTNPTKEDYMQFTNWQDEQLVVEGNGHIQVKIERVNFYVFSTYTSIVHIEHGVTHLGVFGHFIRISNGQFHYPRWLELFD